MTKQNMIWTLSLVGVILLTGCGQKQTQSYPFVHSADEDKKAPNSKRQAPEELQITSLNRSGSG